MLDGWEVRSYEKILSCPKPHTTQAERGSININDQIGSAWRMTLKYDLKFKIEISNDF